MSQIPSRMWRVIKPEGFGNIEIEKADVPVPGPSEILVKNHRTLISRGSEIGGRYRKSDAVDPGIIGYSAAGVVVQVGPDVESSWIGKRVVVSAPHAEYVIGKLDAKFGSFKVTEMAENLSFDDATFHPLTAAGVIWAEIAGIKAGEKVVVMGQGLVGTQCMQAAKAYKPGKLIAVDALPARVDRAPSLGADVAVNAVTEDAVARVIELTDGGADLVMECVGGPAGVKSFPQAVAMTRKLGRIHLISLYHEQPLPLDSGAIQGKMLIGGYFADLAEIWQTRAEDTMARMAAGEFQIEPLISHRFPFSEAKAAFDLLHDRLNEALGVIFVWD
jgi:threonine dehydrogenase-like Zn-dependent dehydrogenase